MVRAVAVAGILLASFALAEDAAARKAREELERELKQMVGTSPTRVRIDFVSPDEPNYKLVEATFEVDGKGVKGLPLDMLSGDGTRTVYSGDVTPGKHTVSAHVTYESQASAVVSDEGGYKWKLGGDATFEIASGLEVQVQVTPIRDSSQKDIGKRFALRMPAAPVMVAKLDDGKMPEKVAVAVAVAKPATSAAAAEPPPTTQEPKASPKPPPEGAKAAAAQATPSPTAPEVPAAASSGDAVAAVDPPAPAAVVDAGPPAAVTSAPVAAPAAAPVTLEDGDGPPAWVWLAGGGVLVAIIFLVALARRRSNVPTLKE